MTATKKVFSDSIQHHLQNYNQRLISSEQEAMETNTLLLIDPSRYSTPTRSIGEPVIPIIYPIKLPITEGFSEILKHLHGHIQTLINFNKNTFENNHVYGKDAEAALVGQINELLRCMIDAMWQFYHQETVERADETEMSLAQKALFVQNVAYLQCFVEVIVTKYIEDAKLQDKIVFEVDRRITKEAGGAEKHDEDAFKGCPELMKELRWKIQLDYETSLTPLICEHLY